MGTIAGLGPSKPALFIYLPHFPPCDHLQALDCIRTAEPGELKQIGIEAGNHWRKIINISAKLGFLLDSKGYPDWQTWRDELHCQEGSSIALIYAADRLKLNSMEARNAIHIVSGHSYCNELCGNLAFERFDEDFQVCRSPRVIDSPYFDYRQLSNAKLEILYKNLL